MQPILNSRECCTANVEKTIKVNSLFVELIFIESKKVEVNN